MSDEMTEQEAKDMLRQFSESKTNAYTFFRDIVKADDTTKTGNLTLEELGMPKLPVRTFKELALFSKDIAGEDKWQDYFEAMSEIHTSTSLSKEAMLIKLAVTTKKELADMTPKKKTNSGWFKGKNRGE